MKADKMLIITNMLEQVISEVDDLKQMIIDMKMDEIRNKEIEDE